MHFLSEITLQLVPAIEFAAQPLSAWVDLETRASVPNAFLSPYFVIPAIRHLMANQNAFGIFIERKTRGTSTLIGVALFQSHQPNRHFPLPHLSMFASVHSYLSGFLVDKDYAQQALQRLAQFLTSEQHFWHGLYCDNFPQELASTPETRAAVSAFGFQWHILQTWQRPVLRPGQDDFHDLTNISHHTHKDYQRHLRQLKALGAVEWVVQRGDKPLDHSLQEFLRLEHMGWKEQQKTSIVSRANDLEFFREMSASFQHAGRLFVTELRLDQTIIASTVNLLSGNAGFGFKLGWDTRYAKYSPGTVNLIQMLEHAEDAFRDLEYIDSSTQPNSYVNKIWPGRRNLIEGWLTLSSLGQAALSSVRFAQKCKAWFLRVAKYRPN